MDRKTKRRADQLLREAYPGLSSRLARACFEAGWVRDASGRRLKKGDLVERVESIEAFLAPLRTGNPRLEVPVLVEREGFVVVDKPPGMAGHPLHLGDRETVTHWAFARYPEMAEEFSGVLPVVTPHRLDTDTSGVLLVARTTQAYAEWRERFRRKEVRKRYLAWCHGSPLEEEWTIDAPIGKAGARRRRVDPLSPYPAQTAFRVLKRESGVFLVEASCKTGVTHQVRVHAAHSGFPLVGDELYGSSEPGRHLLRASELIWKSERFVADTTHFSESVRSALG